MSLDGARDRLSPAAGQERAASERLAEAIDLYRELDMPAWVEVAGTQSRGWAI
jgi:hypothetical protein